MFFFFQAEDGIRDLVRSRGLGDVYKRQEEKQDIKPTNITLFGNASFTMDSLQLVKQTSNNSVSYTHLTLPTSDLV